MTRQTFLRSAAVLALAAAAFVMPVKSDAVQVTAFQQAVAENVSRDDEIAAFYRDRGFAPIWTGDSPADFARRTALIEALASARHHGLPQRSYNQDALLARMASVRNGFDRGALEVQLTELYLDFARDMQTGVIDTPQRVHREIVREIPRRDAGFYLSGLLSDDPSAFIASLVPQSHEYTRLMKAKMRLEHAVSHGGWGATVPSRKMEPGDSGQGVVALRDRLIRMGYLKPTVTASYDAAITEAVATFQDRHGLTADGIAGASTIAEINVAPQDRLKSVMVAMERERWINRPDGLGDRHILVNITDFKARIFDHGKLTFETRSVVGHQELDRQTPEFSDEMDHMVINPSWFVPRSIIVREYLPKLRANPGAVSHLEITDSRGRVVSRNRSFAGYTERNFPFAMRQRPGPRNALGTVKFMFPNKHNIYLHDTPAKSLFSREVRTFSHGCVRLNDPHEFAYALLAPQTDDPVGFFHRTLRTGQETRVNLETPVPVHLIYRTAFTTPKGDVQFRRDVYDRDASIWRALSAAGVEIGGIQS
ncbi:L,D-transpeptidase family protein [Marivita hallyeonensis]|uniref:Murein L,D-transpeptidase YcbB/YkuD n=1 Tax=Marivita hallyeonensis TaxID=996342 RepID=A0A1M5VZN2_9RHOB|nr:L,D-transpeptidase family protein [Marivita hallyeonensis]SHH80695.1 Murein L,D-transpeptidase YcbB/YkuD [Marivita hallyeonensis]